MPNTQMTYEDLKMMKNFVLLMFLSASAILALGIFVYNRKGSTQVKTDENKKWGTNVIIGGSVALVFTICIWIYIIRKYNR